LGTKLATTALPTAVDAAIAPKCRPLVLVFLALSSINRGKEHAEYGGQNDNLHVGSWLNTNVDKNRGAEGVVLGNRPVTVVRIGT